MWTMAKIRDGSTYLSNHLSANDYYAEGEAVVGHWAGRLAEEWGLAGKPIQSRDAVFERLRSGRTHCGTESLRQRQRKCKKGKGSLCFLDFQVSAQKSVSIASLFDPRLKVAHQRAAAESFKIVESFAARRINGEKAGRGNWFETTGKVCAAVFTHDASRALDPQLHSHYVVVNATVSADGKRYGLTERQIFSASRYFGKLYQNNLARECLTLGYQLREKRDKKGKIEGFELAHIDDELCRRYSRRRIQIESEAAKRKETNRGRYPSRAELSIIARETRSKKMSEISTPEVRAQQMARLTSDERDALESAAAEAHSAPPWQALPQNEAENVARTLEHICERRSVMTGHSVIADVLNRGLGKFDAAEVQAALSNQTVRLSQEPLERAQITTSVTLAREKNCLQFVAETAGTMQPLRSELQAEASLEQLSEEQRAAVEFVCRSRDRLSIVRGVAGAGKTTTLLALQEQLAGWNTLHLAPTRGAVEVLRQEGFPEATTVADYLLRARDNKAPAEWRDSFIVVDEAGLLSTAQGSRILTLAKQHGNRVLFVGDAKQHTAVEAGDFLRLLESSTKIQRRELVTIRRQKHEGYRLAIGLMQRGIPSRALREFDRLGWLREDGARYLESAAKTYLKKTANGASALLIAPTWREIGELTQFVRLALQKKGAIRNEREMTVEVPLGTTIAERREADTYRVGQVVHFTADIAGARRGESARIERVSSTGVFLADGRQLALDRADAFDLFATKTIRVGEGDKILLRANQGAGTGIVNGRVVTVAAFGDDGSIRTVEGPKLPASYRRFTHGYAVTSHKSQGATCDHVVVAAERLDAKAAYVATSRGRHSCTIHTPNKKTLRQWMWQTGERQNAVEAQAANATAYAFCQNFMKEATKAKARQKVSV